jgi:hypothetical protein
MLHHDVRIPENLFNLSVRHAVLLEILSRIEIVPLELGIRR